MSRNLLLLFFLSFGNIYAQSTVTYADSIRRTYHIPELNYAVVSGDSILEIRSLGVKKINSGMPASLNDRFRIGSNTKAITGFLAALLVKKNKISWSTHFFDLFPELLPGSRPEYRDITLLQLLSFRASLFPYTYTDTIPKKGQFKGNEDKQRYFFTQWFLKHPPANNKDSISFSNLGYVAAGLMIEKAAGKTYQQQVFDLGKQLDINFGFGQPNMTDSLQTWGHDKYLIPEHPAKNYKLSWLLAAGNINVSLPDYIKFIQLQLKGLNGRSNMLKQHEFEFLHFGLKEFSVGWFWEIDSTGSRISYNMGNPGTFLTRVYIDPSNDRSYILFCNAQTEDADNGLDLLYEELKKKYGR